MNRQQQIKGLFEVALEMRLSDKYYNVLLCQVDKGKAHELREQHMNSAISQMEYKDRLVQSLSATFH